VINHLEHKDFQPKNKFFNNPRQLWGLRYRIISIFLLITLLPSLYSSNFNSPKNVSAIGFVETQKTGVVTKITKSNTVYKSSTFAQGLLDFAKSSSTLDFTNNKDSKLIEKLQTAVNAEIEAGKSRTLNNLVPVPKDAQLTNFLRYPKYGINVPIQYAGLSDLFETDKNGNLIKSGGQYIPILENVEKNGPLGVPIQKLLIDGIVHIGFTPLPGETGNSYIVGHSSNFDSVKSDYNYIFKPLERRSQVGEEFTIYDKQGRELNFVVFETKEILEEDTTEAYKEFGSKRVVTLQCSILEYVPGKGLQPTKRWLTRGELVLK
jgi:Sortase domain